MEGVGFGLGRASGCCGSTGGSTTWVPALDAIALAPSVAFNKMAVGAGSGVALAMGSATVAEVVVDMLLQRKIVIGLFVGGVLQRCNVE